MLIVTRGQSPCIWKWTCTFVLLPFLLRLVNGRATIYFRYDSWTGDGLTSRNIRCDSVSTSRKCDYVFLVRLGDSGKYGRHESLSWDDGPDTITDFSRIMSQPLVFQVQDDPIPEELTVRVDVLDRDHSSDDVIVTFITKVSVTPSLYSDSVVWMASNRSDGKKRLRFSIRIVCSQNYYGSDCMTRCVPQDDDRLGHYNCSRSGSRVCLPSYVPPDCTYRHPCSLNATCSNRGTCIVNGNSYRCLCDSGYNGSRCEQKLDSCSSVVCANGATCESTGNTWRCVCAPGWTGRRCETARVVACDPGLSLSLCKNNASCTREYDDVHGYGAPTCHCTDGYIRPYCAQRHACYRADTCNGGLCVAKNESYECQCNAGYSGVNCQVARDPCLTWQCLNGATCRALGLWNATCVCATGWKGEACQLEETIACDKQCAAGMHCARTLVNNEGNYSEPQCVQMLVRTADAAKMEHGTERGTAIWVYLFVGAAGLLVVLAVVFGLLYARRSKQAHELRVMSRITSHVSGDYSTSVVNNDENFYEDEAQVQFLSQQRQRADSIYDEPMLVDQPSAPNAANEYDQLATVPKQQSVTLSKICESGKLVVILPPSEYDTPSSSAAYSVPPPRSNDSLLARPLPLTPSCADDQSHEKPTAVREKRNSNLYSESPTLQRRERPAENEQAPPQSSAAGADSNEQTPSSNASNVYNVPSSTRSADSKLN